MTSTSIVLSRVQVNKCSEKNYYSTSTKGCQVTAAPAHVTGSHTSVMTCAASFLDWMPKYQRLRFPGPCPPPEAPLPEVPGALLACLGNTGTAMPSHGAARADCDRDPMALISTTSPPDVEAPLIAEGAVEVDPPACSCEPSLLPLHETEGRKVSRGRNTNRLAPLSRCASGMLHRMVTF